MGKSDERFFAAFDGSTCSNPKGIPAQSPGLSTLRSGFEVGFTLGTAATEDGRGTSYPGAASREDFNSNRVVARVGAAGHNPVGVAGFLRISQGSSFLATLGWRPQ